MSSPGTKQTSQTPADATAANVFKLVERLLLIITMLMTLGAVGIEVMSVVERGSIELADLLLMFLYIEVVGMIAVFYTEKGSFFVFPIFIAITAIARLIVLQGKEMAPENVLFDAGAILVLAIAAIVIGRYRSE